MLEQGIYFEEAMLLRMFRSVCRGIDYLHSHEPRWSHGDIKLDNLLLKENGDVILMDFGSISAARKEISDRKQALQLQDWASEHCTIFYRAPELFDVPSRCFIDERTDIWVRTMKN